MLKTFEVTDPYVRKLLSKDSALKNFTRPPHPPHIHTRTHTEETSKCGKRLTPDESSGRYRDIPCAVLSVILTFKKKKKIEEPG